MERKGFSASWTPGCQATQKEEPEQGVPGSFATQRAAFLGLIFPICTMGVFRDSQGALSRASGGRALTCCPHGVHGRVPRPPTAYSQPSGCIQCCCPQNSAHSCSWALRPDISYPPLSQGPRAPGPLFALGRGTCWADVGFPRPPSQRSQTWEGAPWRLLLKAGGKWRHQASNSSAR